PVSLPAALQAGASYGRAVGSRVDLRGALEGRLTRGRNGMALIGAELSGPAGAALRLGLRVNDSASDFTVGAGYSARAVRLDYAFVPMRFELGDTHRFSFSARF